MNPMAVVRRARADRDVDKAAAWYSREAGLNTTQRFIDALQATFDGIAANPDIGSTRYAHELGMEGLRSRMLKGFPYLVFYAEAEGQIEVWRVLHAHRDLPREIDKGEG